MKVANGVEMLELPANLLGGGPSTIHPTIIWDNDTVILVDTGYPGQLPKIREEMEKAGLSFNKLGKVIITHHDMDHIGSLAGILMESSQKVEVLAHEMEKPYIQAERPPIRLAQIKAQLDSLPQERRGQIKGLYETLKANYKNFQAKVDKTVTDGEVLPYCGGISIIYTPGHTPGHICLYLKQSKTLIAGDVMMVDNGRLVPPPEIITVDKDSAVKSLQKLTKYDIETAICYHGGLYKENVNQRIVELAAM